MRLKTPPSITQPTRINIHLIHDVQQTFYQIKKKQFTHDHRITKITFSNKYEYSETKVNNKL